MELQLTTRSQPLNLLPPFSFNGKIPKVSVSCNGWRNQNAQLGNASKCYMVPFFPIEKWHKKKNVLFCLPNSNIATTGSTSDSDQDASLNSSSKINKRASNHTEPFRGKSGSVSFFGLTHQLIEERKLVSSPFKDESGSFIWILGPVSLIASVLLPQFFLSNVIDVVVRDEILADIITTLSSEAMFYCGLAAFLLVTDRVQKPYLEFSAKRWGLITGLRGYLSVAFFIMGFKVFAPILAVYVVWPAIGLPALVAVAPYLLGCAAQFAFEARLEKWNSSCWPLVPIIFEVYRLYQLSKAAHFIESLMFAMKGSAVTPELLERSSALASMMALFHALGIVCLWSLTSFLLRLFPSRPVAENY